MKLRTLFIIALLPGLISCAKWYKPILAPVGIVALPVVVVMWGACKGSKTIHYEMQYTYRALPIGEKSNATCLYPWSNQPRAGFRQWIVFPVDEQKTPLNYVNRYETNLQTNFITNSNDEVFVLQSGESVSFDLEDPQTINGINVASCLSKSNHKFITCCIRFYLEDGSYQDECYIPYGWNVGSTLNGAPLQAPRQEGNDIYLVAQTNDDKEIIGRLRIDVVNLFLPMPVSKVEFRFDKQVDDVELLIAAAALYRVERKDEGEE